MDYFSAMCFINTDFGKCFYFKSIYYSGMESSKELVPDGISDKIKMEMIRERQHHFDNNCFDIVRSNNITANMDLAKIDNIQFQGIDTKDYPDFTDAYISNADYNGEEMTEAQLDEINKNTEFVHEKLIEYLY